MVGLLDIARATEIVCVAGGEVEVRGISAKDVAALFGRFPELRMMLSGKEIEPESLIEFAPGAIASIIAAGCGALNSQEYEERASELPIDGQVDILSAILRLTMPGGFGPFVEKLSGLGLVPKRDGKSARGQDTK